MIRDIEAMQRDLEAIQNDIDQLEMEKARTTEALILLQEERAHGREMLLHEMS